MLNFNQKKDGILKKIYDNHYINIFDSVNKVLYLNSKIYSEFCEICNLLFEIIYEHGNFNN